MAVTLSFRWLYWLLPFTLWSACRDVSVCGRDGVCGARAGDGGRSPIETGAPSVDGAGATNDAGGRAAHDTAGGDTAGGDSTESGAAGTSGATQSQSGGDSDPSAGAAGAPTALLPCAAGTAECDASTFTHCETPLMFSSRHCGACDQRCQGACTSGQCAPGESVLVNHVGSFTATAARGFMLANGTFINPDLYRVDLDTGQTQLIAEDLDVSQNDVIAVGSDRVYAALRSGEVVSFNFDGSAPQREPFEATSIAGTSAGLYYTNSASGGTLWYKATAAPSFVPLLQGASCLACVIRASSRFGIVLQRGTADAPSFAVVRGTESTFLVNPPPDLRRLFPTKEGVAALIRDDNSPSGAKLLWFFPDHNPYNIPLESKLVAWQLVEAPNGVALAMEERANRFVQMFTADGPGVRVGLPNTADIAHVSERYVWFEWLNPVDLTRTFARAHQLESAVAVPMH